MMLSNADFYKLISLPQEIIVLFTRYDHERKPVLTSELEQRLLNRSTWSGAIQDLKKSLGEDPGNLLILWEMVRVACRTYERYLKRGIPEAIYIDTMKFCTRYLLDAYKSNGIYRFSAPWWFPRQLSMELFRLGALEYEFINTPEEKVISLHIPSDADMTPSVLDTSLNECRQFQMTFFPDFVDVPWICDSWMLSPVLPALLPESSRILAFQRRFIIDLNNADSNDALTWVFPDHKEDLNQLPERTSLQRTMKAYVLTGQKIGWTRGHMAAPPAVPDTQS